MARHFELASIIVSTYNRPEALRAVLSALADQTDRAFEVIVADDGSGPETAALVRDWGKAATVPVRHAWQEDDGFRAARGRNNATRMAKGDYLVFLDGDCVPRPHFLAAHRRLAERGWFVRGTRASLAGSLTRRVESEGLAAHRRSLARWLMSTAKRDIKDVSPLLAWPSERFRKRTPHRWRGVQTCNLGVWAEDYLAVDGLDESYVGWGMEDADLAVRLIRSERFRKEGKFATAVLHLWHPPNDRAALAENQRLFDDTLHGDRIRARVGLSSHETGS